MTISAVTEGLFGAAFEWLGIERAWTRTRGASVVIGIVDQGVQLDHPLLGPNIQPDHALLPAPAGDHEIAGTHAAGVAAGRSSEVEKFSGVAPAARILPVRFNGGSGPQALDLAHAIEYAVEMGASVINIAASDGIATAAVLRAMQYAAARNVLVICAASTSVPAPLPPASEDPLPNRIAVLSIDEHFQPLSEDAPRGAHLAAPGFARVPLWRGRGHTRSQHAALGSPYVAGCAALVKALNPAWGYHEIKEHLLASGTPHPHLKDKCQSGRILNVANAVLGPIELLVDGRELAWSSLNDAVIRWRLRYRSGFCAHAVALYRPQGDTHWRELGVARSDVQTMTIPAAALRRSSGTLRIACREANFSSDEIPLTIS
jgi:hypothetical protein